MEMYDSDASLSIGPEDMQIPEDDIDADKQHLIAQNAELMQECAKLKSQFEEMSTMAAQFDDFSAQHRRVQDELRQQKLMTGNLNDKLDICRKKIEDLTAENKQLKMRNQHQAENNTVVMNTQIEKIRQEAKAHEDDLYNQLDNMKAEYDKVMLQRKVMDGKISKLIQAAELHFGAPLGNIDAVITSLETLDVKPQTRSDAPAPRENNDHELMQLKKKLKKYKTKCSSIAKEKEEMELSLQKSKADLKQATMEHKNQLMNFETKLEEISNEQESREAKQKKLVLKLEGQIHDLENKLERAKDMPPPPPPAPVKIVVKEVDETKVKELEKQREDLISKISALSQQLQTSQNKKDEMVAALKASEDKCTDLKIQCEKLNNEVTALKSVRQEMENEKEMLRQALRTATTVKEEEKPKKVETVETARIKRYQHEIDARQKQITDLTAEAVQQKREIESQAGKIRALESAKQEIEDELKKTKEMLNEQRAKVDMKKRCVPPEELISANDFICPSFDAPLANTIKRVACNQSLSPASKIQGCFSAIGNYFGEKMQELDAAFQDSLSDAQKLKTACNKFVVDMSIAITDQPQTVDDVLTTSVGQELIERVNNLRVSADAMKRERDQMKGILSHLSETFERSDDDPVATINELKEVLMAQQTRLAKKSKQLKLSRAEAAKLDKLIKTKEQEHDAVIMELQGELENVSSQLASTTKALTTAKIENEDLLTQITNLNRDIACLQERVIEVEINTTKRITDESNVRINALNKEIDKFREQVKQLVDDANHDREEITKLKNLNQSLTHQLSAVSDENKDLKQKVADDQQRFDKQNESEKSGIKDSYESAIAELREQCEKHREDFQRITAEKMAVEEKLKSAKAENSRLIKECKALNGDITNLQAKFARDKKLLETSATAKRIEYECNFNMKLDEARSKFDYEMKQICSFCAETLNMFFDPNEEISDRSTRRVIEMAKEEITRLTASDLAVRRLVDAREGQETEDAVARIVLRM